MFISMITITLIIAAVVVWAVALFLDDSKSKGVLTTIGFILFGFGLGWLVLQNLLLILVIIICILAIRLLYKKYK